MQSIKFLILSILKILRMSIANSPIKRTVKTKKGMNKITNFLITALGIAVLVHMTLLCISIIVMIRKKPKVYEVLRAFELAVCLLCIISFILELL